jgi:hypothetical protein
LVYIIWPNQADVEEQLHINIRKNRTIKGVKATGRISNEFNLLNEDLVLVVIEYVLFVKVGKQ